MSYHSRAAVDLDAEPVMMPMPDDAPEGGPRWPKNWTALLEGAEALAPRIVQLTARTWAVPSGSNPTHGYIVTAPAEAPRHSTDVGGYTCGCAWCQPQGPAERPGVGCRHALAVVRRRLDAARRNGRRAA